jgi:hypothetical protein
MWCAVIYMVLYFHSSFIIISSSAWFILYQDYVIVYMCYIYSYLEDSEGKPDGLWKLFVYEGGEDIWATL